MRANLLLVFVMGCGGSGTVDLTTDGGTDATNGGSDAADTGSDVAEANAPDVGSDAPAGMMFKCGDTMTVADCSTCTNATQPCVYCNVQTPGTMVGICTALHSNCIGAIPMNFQDCHCGTTVSSCPEAYQICNATGSCHTCSDATGNQGLMCQGGGTCNATTGICM